jgi:outer membrane protein
MKKVILSIFATGLLVFVGFAFAASGVKIGVFNLQTVLQQTPQLKAVQDKLRSKFTARNNDMIAKQKQLIADISKLRNLPLTQNRARSNLQVKIINESSDLRAKRTVLERDILVARNENLQAMMKKIRDKAGVIANKAGLDLVIANVNIAYSAGNTDVTKDLIRALK